jgi:hypothetical protein
MSLILAQQKRKVIAAVSDTGITEHGKQLPRARHIPKICIVHPDLAVAFAGNPDLAKRYLHGFPAGLNYKGIVDYLLSCHKDANGEVDFLALFNRPIPKIVAVRAGRVMQPQQTAWIGDHAAFEVVQRNKHSAAARAARLPFESTQIMSTLESEAHPDNATYPLLAQLQDVITDTTVASVFGFGVAINNVDGVFQYRAYTLVLAQKEIGLLLPAEFILRTAAERAEAVNYSACCFVTQSDSDIAAVAYHFPYGKLTYMYWGKKGALLENYRPYTGKNIQEFVDETREEFSITAWRGTVQLRRPPPPDYGIPVEKWRIEDGSLRIRVSGKQGRPPTK